VKRRILYFSKTDSTGPSSRYRIYQLVPGLEKAGIRVDVSPLFKRFYFTLIEQPAPIRIPAKVFYSAWRFLLRGARLFCAGRYDKVVIEHQLFPYMPPWAERLLCLLGKRFVLEFDDAIYLTPFHKNKMKALTRIAERVIVGNRFLETFARRQSSGVSVVPTVVDLTKYTLKREYSLSRGGPVVGWVGLKYNFPYLQEIGDVMPEGARLRVVSSSRPKIEKTDVDFVQWSKEKEPGLIAGFDIGIMPLPDTEWARGKCGLKMLQYMAAGVPVVASSAGVNADIIEHGKNGFLADSPEEWKDALARLIESKELRESMGKAGRKTVEDAYSLDHGIELLTGIYGEAAMEGAAPSAP